MDLWKKLPKGYNTMPTIEYYKTERKKTDAVFIVFPGGGYTHLAEHEGVGYAKMFNVWGADAFVVKYSVAPSRFPAQLNDARRAVQFVRANALEYGINPEKIIVVGSSAGGHLASMVSTFRGEVDYPENDEISKQNFMPNYQVLCYPVVDLVNDEIANNGSRISVLGEDYSSLMTEKLSAQLACDKDTPPAFI